MSQCRLTNLGYRAEAVCFADGKSAPANVPAFLWTIAGLTKGVNEHGR